MPSGGPKSFEASVAVRMSAKLRDALETEAQKYNRRLSDYIRCVLSVFVGVKEHDSLKEELRKRMKR